MRSTVPPSAMFGLFLFLLSGNAPPASARDLNVLIRVGYAAFLAEQGSAMCNLHRLSLSKGDRAVFESAHEYANWAKQQISAGLSDDDVRYVLKSAADRARNEMLEVVRALKSNPPDVESAELLLWCTGTMKGVVEKVVNAHLDNPGVIERIISKAKEE